MSSGFTIHGGRYLLPATLFCLELIVGVVSSTVVQKQVGHTIVHLPHDRHRPATAPQRGDSRLPASSARRSPAGSRRRIRSPAPATAVAARPVSAGSRSTSDSVSGRGGRPR